jgi:hypothetical protein
MILTWKERPARGWTYPRQLLKNDYVVGGVRQRDDGMWTAADFITTMRSPLLRTREEAEAWLIAVVRMSQ